MATRHRIPDFIRDKIVELYKSGATAQEAAGAYGYCRSVCLNALSKAGLLTRFSQGRIEANRQVAAGVRRCKLCGELKPLSQMLRGRKIGCGYTTRCRDCASTTRGGKRCKPPLISLRISERAYFAGLIDGEGCITLVRKRDVEHYCGKIEIGMTGDELFELKTQIGAGRIWTRSNDGRNAKPCHMWTIGANACRTLLPQIAPYLRFKKRQADLLLEYLRLTDRITRKDKSMMAAHFKRIREIYCELRALNARGRRTAGA